MFISSVQSIKYLGLTLVKYMQTSPLNNIKLREIKEDLNKCIDLGHWKSQYCQEVSSL